VEVNASYEMSECWWKLINWLVNFPPVLRCVSVGGRLSTGSNMFCYLEECECGWQIINWLVEAFSKFKVGNCEWEFMNWMVKVISKFKINECLWQVINWLVEFISKFEVSNCGWKFINWLIDSKCEMNETVWEVVN
jgi:hypothetical protein